MNAYGATCKPDGRWAADYRESGKVKWEYFGRRPEVEAAAYLCNADLTGGEPQEIERQ